MEEKLHDKYYKYLAEYFQLSFEQQCETPILSFDEWVEKNKA